MAYCMFRLFRESRHDGTRFERLRAEMMPKLRAIPGFQRFGGLVTNDGRYGGFQVFDTRQGVEQARQLFNDWRRANGDQDAPLLDVAGEIGLSIARRADYEKGYAVARLYRISAPFKEINDAILQEGGQTIRAIPGLYRYATALLDDGRLGVFNAFETEQGARDMTAKARELRGHAGSKLATVLPADPEVIECQMELAFAAEPASVHAA